MARRRRKRRRRETAPREGATASPGPSRATPKRPPRRGPDEPPPAPWGSFPLVELVVLVGIVLFIAGLVVSGERGMAMLLTGLALGSLGGLELSIREHFAGYRSHTLVLAAVPAVIVLAALFFLAPSLPMVARLGAAAAVFGLGAWALTAAFRRRSGGLAFRIKGFRG